MIGGLVLLVFVLLGVTLTALRSDSVQTWLLEYANGALQPPLGQPAGLWARIIRLSGPLPFGFDAALECHDGNGVWLRAPKVTFDWRLAALPQTVLISMELEDAELLRLPEAVPATQGPPAEPMDEAGLRCLMGDILRSLHSLPDWLPEARLDSLRVKKFRFPQKLLASGNDVPSTESVHSSETESSVVPCVNADMALSLAAGIHGAKLDGEVTLATAENTKLSLVGVDAKALRAQLRCVLGLPRSDKNLGMDVGAELGFRFETDFPSRQDSAEAPPLAVVLGRGAEVDVHLEGGITAPVDTGGADTARAALSSLRVDAGPLSAQGHVVWNTQSGVDVAVSERRSSGEEITAPSWFTGGLDAVFEATMTPVREMSAHQDSTTGLSTGTKRDMPLDVLSAPLKVRMAADGPLESPKVEISMECAKAEIEGHSLAKTLARLDSAILHWRDLVAFFDTSSAATPLSQDKTEVGCHFETEMDKQNVHCSFSLFALPVFDRNRKCLHTGLRELRGNVMGVELAGIVTSILPVPLGGALPAFEGEITVRSGNLNNFSFLLPGTHLAGEAGISLNLESRSAVGDKPEATSVSSTQQHAALRWRVPHLEYGETGGDILSVRELQGEIVLKDLWGKGLVDSRVNLDSLQQGERKLHAGVRVQGSLQGPLQCRFESGGFVKTHGELAWKPGHVDVRRLEAFLPTYRLGLKAAPGASVAYGEDGLRLGGIDLSLKPGGRVLADAALGKTSMDVQLDVEKLNFAHWKPLVQELPEGTAEAHVRISGNMASPDGNIRLTVRGLHAKGSTTKPLNMELAGKLEREASGGALALRLLLDPASVRNLGGTECRVEARVPLQYNSDALPQPAMQGPLRAVVRWSGEVAPLWALLPLHDQRLGGKLGVALDVSGSLVAPSLKGAVKMERAHYEHVDLGVLMPTVNMQVDFDHNGKNGPGKANVHFDAADGQGGTVRVTGTAGMDGKMLDITTVIGHLRPLRRRDVRVDLSGNIAVRGEALAPIIHGKIVVNQGVVLLNRLNMGGGSVTTVPVREDIPAWVRGMGQVLPGTVSGGKVTDTPNETVDNGSGQVDVQILMPGRFLVEGFGLQSEWKTDMRIKGSPFAPVISGQVEATKGQLDILGKIFKLSRGVVTFGGGNVANPLLDIMLTNQTSALTANMAITGTVHKMQLTLSSDPVLPRDEILARMLFGKSASELGRLENLRLAAAVAQLAGFGTGDGEGGGVLDSTREALGMDVLRFNTSSDAASNNSHSSDVTSGTSVEMGKYLSEDVYVGVQQGAKQGSTAFVIQLEMTPRANVEVRTEQNGTSGGLNWKYDY
ncbi:MAG: translocation/assembly module TamB [Desulfovibrio sp.]|nr:translocation/assembly module TamB [Desulfovibrio sp.]